MEINFVRDKDVIDVPTIRGKIKRLVLSAIIVDPGSNTLLIGVLQISINTNIVYHTYKKSYVRIFYWEKCRSIL